MLEVDKIYLGDCSEVMKQIDDNSIDMILTSPPYDNLRNYKGYTFNFEKIAKELYRISKNGSILVWIVNDSTIDGSETGCSFKQALFFKEIGFNLHDTMIYWKNSFQFPEQNRYANNFEYMFIFSKGRPRTTNIFKVPTNKENRIKNKNSNYRTVSGETTPMKYATGKDERNKENIWIYEVGYQKSTNDKEAYEHPAIFPEKLAQDHILSWSNEGDLILDPMCGSGTTLKMAKKNKRKFIGIEISQEYYKLACRRIDLTMINLI